MVDEAFNAVCGRYPSRAATISWPKSQISIGANVGQPHEGER
jgi:hypothetical protein